MATTNTPMAWTSLLLAEYDELLETRKVAEATGQKEALERLDAMADRVGLHTVLAYIDATGSYGVRKQLIAWFDRGDLARPTWLVKNPVRATVEKWREANPDWKQRAEEYIQQERQRRTHGS